MIKTIQNSKFKIQNLDNNTGELPSPSTQTGKASSMAELMAKTQHVGATLRKGDVLAGIVTKLTPSEILIDINAKTEAVVLEKDKHLLRNLLSSLNVGDKVNVSVLNPESDFGYPVVSLRRFLDDISWKRLEVLQKEQTMTNVSITGVTRGGFLATTRDGIAGFLPQSQVTVSHQDLVGQNLDVYVVEVGRAASKVIFSQKPLVSTEAFDTAIKTLRKGQTMEVTVATVTSFGIFVSVPAGDTMLDGLIHISEVAWEKVESIQDMFTVGQVMSVAVIGFDKESKRVDLSLKRLTKDPFEDAVKDLAVEQKVKGIVKEVVTSGVVVLLAGLTSAGQDIEGLIRKEKIPPTVAYKAGESIQATITQIDKKHRRILLSPVLMEKPIGYR